MVVHGGRRTPFWGIRHRSSALLVMALLPASVLVSPAAPAQSAAPTPAAACVDVQPNAKSARAMLATCGRQVEILSERTEYAQTFLNPDGSLTLEQGVEPVAGTQG